MQKTIITLLCAASMAFSEAADLSLRPDAPARYEVQPDDTLWTLAKLYLERPWQWNELWGSRRNPQDLAEAGIYPGQVLELHDDRGRKSLGFASNQNSDGIPTVKLSPRIRKNQTNGIPAINTDFYRLFMKQPQIISPQQTQNAPRLIGGTDRRLLYSQGDRVYALGANEPGRYLVYRPVKDLVDPETKQFLGQEIMFSGIIGTLPLRNSALEQRSKTDAARLNSSEYYTRLHPLIKVPTQTAQPMAVEEAVAEIRKGDFLMKLDEAALDLRMMPHAPEQAVDAKVIAVFDGIDSAGSLQTVTLNKGEADGLDRGAVIGLYKRSRQIRTELEESPKGRRSTVKFVSLPAESVGLAIVYRTAEHAASAVILESSSEINLGDTAGNPGRDLDNLPNDSAHRRNEPQDPHDTAERYSIHSNIQPF